MILSQSEAKKITDRLLSLSKADTCTVALSGHLRRHVRFALNSVTTAGEQDDVSVSVTSSFGNRSGSARTNEFTDAALERVVRKSEEIAKFAPPNPEFVPPFGPQQYLEGRTWFEGTAKAGPEEMAGMTRPVLETATKKEVTAAGFFSVGSASSSIATSKGLFAHDNATGALFSVSARTSDGTGAGWSGVKYHDIGRLAPNVLGERAVQKTVESRGPLPLEPGKYLVLLEPSAVCDLLSMLVWQADARSADEGRSFFSKKGGGNKLGEKIFADKVNVYADPHDPIAPGAIYSEHGLPVRKRNWIENGTLKELMYSPYWAKKTGHEPMPHPTNLLMEGGTASQEELIANVKRGILVTRFWY